MPVLAQERSLSLKYSRQRRKRREINYLDSHPCRPPLVGGRFLQRKVFRRQVACLFSPSAGKRILDYSCAA